MADTTPNTTPNTTPAAPAAAPASAAPAAPVPDPVKQSTFSALLGLVKPEKADVTPTPEPKVEPKPEPKAEPKPEPAPEPKKPKATATPRKPVDVGSIVKQTIEAVKATEPKPEPKVEAPKVEEDTDLTPDEKEELDLIKYAETKDPSKKGLADKYRAFYKASRAKIEELQKEDPEANPLDDPRFKSWLAKNEPKMSQAERKVLFREATAARAKEEALKEAEQKFNPRIEELERRHREVVETPKITREVEDLEVGVSAEAVPTEMRQFLTENKGDIEKLKAQYPIEYEVIDRTIENAKKVYSEYLRIGRGVTPFSQNNHAHAYLGRFLAEQAQEVIASGKTLKDGKQFVPLHEWQAGMEATRWTFTDADVRSRLQKVAVSGIQERISTERERMKPYLKAPVGATSSAPVATPPVEAVPKANAGAPSGGATTTPPRTTGGFSGMLGIGKHQ